MNACFYITKVILPPMISKKWWRIMNIAGVHGLVASLNKSANITSNMDKL